MTTERKTEILGLRRHGEGEHRCCHQYKSCFHTLCFVSALLNHGIRLPNRAAYSGSRHHANSPADPLQDLSRRTVFPKDCL